MRLFKTSIFGLYIILFCFIGIFKSHAQECDIYPSSSDVSLYSPDYSATISLQIPDGCSVNVSATESWLNATFNESDNTVTITADGPTEYAREGYISINNINAITVHQNDCLVPHAPSVISTSNLTVCKGSSVDFSVEAEEVDYVWTVIGGTITSGQGTNSISATITGNNPSVMVYATNSCGSSGTSSRGVFVYAPVSITNQPTNVQVCEGSSASFNVEASGSGFSYFWQYSADNGSTWLTASGGTNSTFNVGTTSNSMNGYLYRCRLSSSCGTVYSGSAKLTVNARRQLTVNIQEDSPFCKGQTNSTISASVTNPVGNLTYSWYRNNNPVSGQNGSVYTPSTSFQDNETVYCIVTSDNNCTTSGNSGPLTIINKDVPATPQIIGGATLCANAPTTFNIDPVEEVEYNWTVYGGTIGSGQGTSSVSCTFTSGTNKSISVSLENTCGSSGTASLGISVGTPPSVTNHPSNVTLCEGLPASFNVGASGSSISYSWEYSTNNGSTWMTISGAPNNSTLPLSTSNSMNGYLYRCRLSNSCGTVYSGSAKLTVNARRQLTVNIQEDSPFCKGQTNSTISATVNNALGNLTYSWYRNNNPVSRQNGSVFTPSTPFQDNETVYCIVTSDNNCTTSGNSVPLTIINNDVPAIPQIIGDATLCANASKKFYIDPVEEVEYNWTVYGGTIGSGQGTSSVNCTFTPGTNKSITLSLKNTCGSSGLASLGIMVDAPPSFTVQPSNASVCNGEEASFSINTSTAYPSLHWERSMNGGAWLDINESNVHELTYRTSSNMAMNGYKYRCVADHNCGTMYSDEAILEVNSLPTVNITSSSNVVCSGTPVDLNGNPTGGSGSYSNHVWTGEGAASLNYANVVSPVFSNSQAGTYPLTYSVTDSKGCTGSGTLNIVIKESPLSPVVQQPYNIDYNTSGTLSATGAQQNEVYKWYSVSSGGNALTGTTIPNLTQTTTYYVTKYNTETTCESTPRTSFTITVQMRPTYKTSSDRNFVETITFDENGEIDGQSITYYDDLGRPEQALARSIVTGRVTATQTIYDAQGRAAISTLPVPVKQTSLEFIEDLVTSDDQGSRYTYENFEKSDPDGIHGKLADYYSDNNSDEPYAPASAFPYSRTVFSSILAGTAVRSSIPGESFKIGSGHEAVSISLPVPDTELKSYADEFSSLTDASLEHKALSKTIAIDADGRASVVYTSSDGKTVSSCYVDQTVTPVEIVAPVNGEFRYYDIYVPSDNSPVLVNNAVEFKVYDLTTDKEIGVYTGSASLPKGFYRIDCQGTVPENTTVTYQVKQLGHSFNIYDLAGRLKYSFSPKGFDEWKVSKNVNEITKYASTSSYNSLGWVLSSQTPDEGLTEFKYAKDGKIRYSQNAKQRVKNDDPANTIKATYSYTNYDKLGRPVESGEFTGDFNGADVDLPLTEDTKEVVTNKKFVTNTFYDLPETTESLPLTQHYTYGGVVKTSNDNATTWYSYTYDGKTEWIIKRIPDLPDKTVEYQYDFDGKVTEVVYQKASTTEKFSHQYNYDSDQRLLSVYTRKGEEDPLLQARYLYYLHGPLKRVELADNLQGTDYVYTINGQLKAINHPDLDGKDPGIDGYNGNHINFGKDVFGMSLSYFNDDYEREGKNVGSVTGAGYYNGNIAFTNYAVLTDATGGKMTGAYRFTYNNRNWLEAAEFGKTAWNETSGKYDFSLDGTKYQEKISEYDLNGNIMKLSRSSDVMIDNLTYHYNPNTNQLEHITDSEGTTPFQGDIDNQAENNYGYDETGRLIKNASENQYFIYDVFGHVTSIYNNASLTGTPLATYTYDDAGFRVKKEIGGITTWYVRDASGNILSTYVKDENQIRLDEVNLYGSSRLGMMHVDKNSSVGSYIYELTDHLGNVRATIMRLDGNTPSSLEYHSALTGNVNALATNTITLSDGFSTSGYSFFARVVTGAYDILSYADYYPGGMEIPGRKYVSGSQYKFGFQGRYSEKDQETGLNHFEAREYDSRIWRWLSPDQHKQFWSPYIGMGNNPVSGVDPNGKDVVYLLDPNGGEGHGHAALLIGDDKNGWNLYSKNGWESSATDDIGTHFNTYKDFVKAKSRYSKGVYIKTTPEETNTLKESAEFFINYEYSITEYNCADFARITLEYKMFDLGEKMRDRDWRMLWQSFTKPNWEFPQVLNRTGGREVTPNKFKTEIIVGPLFTGPNQVEDALKWDGNN